MPLRKDAPAKHELSINELHRIVDDVVIADENTAWYEVVFAPDVVTPDVYVASKIFIDHDAKQLRIVI